MFSRRYGISLLVRVQLESRGPCAYRRILVYTICLITIRNSVSDAATNISLLNIERSQYD